MSDQPTLADFPVVIVVFTQPGCEGCKDFGPKFEQVSKRWKDCIPSAMVVADEHPQAADVYRIRATPTTVILYQGRKSAYFLEGDADVGAIEQLFQYASFGEGCPV